jgi:hypothetical protein
MLPRRLWQAQQGRETVDSGLPQKKMFDLSLEHTKYRFDKSPQQIQLGDEEVEVVQSSDAKEGGPSC